MLLECSSGMQQQKTAMIAPPAITAVSQLLYPEATVAKSHFPQENAALRRSNKGTFTVEPL
jgi:hypothetical protein